MNYLERLKKLEEEMAAPVAGTPVRWLEAVRTIIAERERNLCEPWDGHEFKEIKQGVWKCSSCDKAPTLYTVPPLPSISRKALHNALDDAEESSPTGEDSYVVIQKALESLGIKVTP